MTSETPDTRLLDEAALIFVQLRDAPQDPEFLAQRDVFLARGAAEKAAYAKIEASWRVSGGRTRSTLRIVLPLLIALGAAVTLGFEPARIHLQADAITGRVQEDIQLASGDQAYLDAGSALVDDTQTGTRSVTLLRGAALFEVAPEDRPFQVLLGEVEVTVRSTIFETVTDKDRASVRVAEGAVDVRAGGQTWLLLDGQRLDWSPQTGGILSQTAASEIAPWRLERLTVTDMTVAEIIDALDRRVSGRIFVLSPDLAEVKISGSFDLGDPNSALRSLAAITDARLIPAGPFGALLIARQ